jgi:hypothetical protein
MSMRSGNREPIWDNAHAVPTPWAREHSEPSLADRTMGFFYKRLQYRGSVNHAQRNKRQPLPKSLDILGQEGYDAGQPVPVHQEHPDESEKL